MSATKTRGQDKAVCIVGAGAAGLWAAAAIARHGVGVVLLEKTGRTGTKILASGGGRCNLTTALDGQAAARAFGAGESFVRFAFRALPPKAVREHFGERGVPTLVEPAMDKVFPASERAQDVRDALLKDALGHGVELRLHQAVSAVERLPDGTYKVVLESGESLLCTTLVLCPGGKSYPKTGTTGDGFGWLRALGLQQVPPVPSLTPLSSSASWVHELSGLTLDKVELRLTTLEGRVIARRRRPLLFTHRGVSGPGPMDLSLHVARGLADSSAKTRGADGSVFVLAIDLLPDVDEEQLRGLLIEANQQRGVVGLRSLLGPGIPRKLWPQLVRQARLGDSMPDLKSLDRKGRNRLVAALKGLRVPIDGTLGFNKAESTSGGLPLHRVNAKTMEVKGYGGLYVVGEMLNLDCPIGGFSFQAAFATAELAARHIVASSIS